MIERVCLECGKPIQGPAFKRYCSASCRGKANKRNAAGVHRPLALPAGSTGAVGELLVAADLLQHGFQVFRACSPSALWDLTAWRDGRFYRVECRTGTVHGDRVYYAKKPTDAGDVYAVVVPTRLGVEYHPDILAPQVSDRPIEIRTPTPAQSGER